METPNEEIESMQGSSQSGIIGCAAECVLYSVNTVVV